MPSLDTHARVIGSQLSTTPFSSSTRLVRDFRFDLTGAETIVAVMVGNKSRLNGQVSTLAPSRLAAEWFLVDRWTGSRGFTLPIGPRGLYREMLTQAWLRGAQLPTDHSQIRRMTGVTPTEWRQCWPAVKPFWTVKRGRTRADDVLINETQVAIYAESKRRTVDAHGRAKNAANARWRRRIRRKKSKRSK